MTCQQGAFVFLDPGTLVDGDLELVLVGTRSPDPDRGLVPEYIFEMRLAGKDVKIGNVSLRAGYTEKLKRYGGNIGYGVAPQYRGHRYAARSCRLLFGLAKRHGMDWIWLTCSPDNVPSRRTCELIGARHVDTVQAEVEPNVFEPKCRYCLDLRRPDRA